MSLYLYMLCISKIKNILHCRAAIIPPNKINRNPLESSNTQSYSYFPVCIKNTF